MSAIRRRLSSRLLLGAGGGLCVLVGLLAWALVHPGPSYRLQLGLGAARPRVPSGQITARLEDRRGRSVPAADVRAFPLVAGAPAGPGIAATGDGSGWVEVALPAPGTYQVVISAPGFAREARTVRVLREGPVPLGRVAMVPEHLVEGRVVGPRGEPVPGALVWAQDELDLPQRPSGPPFLALASSDGRFRLHGLRGNTYQVTARYPGYGASVHREVQAPRLGLVVKLPRLLELAGTVRWQGAPVAGAWVYVSGSGRWPAARLSTDRQGRFRLTDLQEGFYEVRAVHGAKVSRSGAPVELPAEGAALPVNLDLEQGTLVVGRVIDAETRQGIVGARITASEELLALSPSLGESRGDGVFYLGPLLPGEYQLGVDAEGYLPRQGIPFTVSLAQWEPLAVGLERGAEIQGEVVDDVGRTVAGARIELLGRAQGAHIVDRSAPADEARSRLWDRAMRSSTELLAELPEHFLGVLAGPIPLPPAVDSPGDLTGGGSGPAPLVSRGDALLTDARGRFTVRGIPPGSVTIVVRHADYAEAKAGPFRLKLGETKRGVVVKVRPGVALEGTVVDAAGEPVPGAQVAAAREGDPFHAAVRFSDATGAFAFANLVGATRLAVTAPGYVDAVRRVDLGSPAPGAKPHTVTLRLDRADCELAGTLVDRRGLPVVEASVTLTSVTPDAPGRGAAITDASGRFVVLGLGRIAYRAVIAHPDFPRVREEVRCPTDLRLVLASGGGLAFDVRDEKTGDPVPTFQYVLRRAGGPVVRDVGHAGRAEVVPIPAGRYQLKVTALGYAERTLDVGVPAGEQARQLTRRGVVVRLALAGQVAGRVRDARGFPAPEAVVRVAGLEAVTDRDGQFTVEGVPPGTHELVAVHPDLGAGSLGDVVVESGLRRSGLVVDLVAGQKAPAQAVEASVPIRLGLQRGQVTVTAVTEHSQAERAGAAVGDRVLEVDGQEVEGLGLADVRALLRGPNGTPVVLEVRRGDRRIRLPLKRELVE